MTRLPGLLLLLVTALPLVGRAGAQVDPSGTWRTLHTPHFRIHFRPGYRDVAHEAAREAERAYRLLASELVPPRGVADLTLGDDIDAANAFAAIFPSNRITLFLTPGAADPGLQHYDSWLRLVTVHELTHLFHLDRSRGFWAGLQRVFGRLPGIFPNSYQPSWVIEGLATYYESRFTSAGRVKGSFHTEILAADRAGDASRSPWDALLFTRWPDGVVPYAYGSRFFAHLALVAGDSAVPRFIEATARQTIPYRVGRQLRRIAAGRGGGGELEVEWPAATRLPPAAVPSSLGGASARVVDRGLWTQPVPRVSPDGRRIAYVRDDGKGARELRVIDARDYRRLRAHQVNGGVSYDWLGDTLVVAQLDFTGRWRIRSDLYRWLPNGEWRRETYGARLTQPRAGSGLLAGIVLEPGGNRPALPGAESAGGAGRGVTWGGVVPSPDGRWMAATRHADGRWALVRWPAGSPDSVAVLVESGGVLADPTWTPEPDGAPLFVSDRSGFPQVYRWNDGTGATPLTAEPLGARAPAALPDGTLLYATLTAGGWELRHAPARPMSPPPLGWSVGVPARAVPFDSAPAVPTRETGYAAAPSLRPHFWVPLFQDDFGTGRFFGAATAGSDALGRYVYVAQGFAAWDPVRAAGALTVVSRGLGNPTLDVSLSSDWVHTGRTAGGTVVSEREQEAAVGASFVVRRWNTVASLRVAAEYEGSRFVARPDTALAAVCIGCASRDLVGGSVSLGLSRFVLAPLAISPEQGFAWTATYRRREQQGLPRWSDELRGRLRLYARLPGIGGFAHPVLAVRLAAGGTAGPLVETLSVGGVSAGTLDLGFGQSLGATRDFPVRGYARGELRGRRAATASVEIRLPVALIGRSLGHLPVGTDRLSLSLFGDIGDAWNPGTPARLTRLRSAGVEVVGDLTFNYDVPLRLRVGLAQPLADPPSGRSRRPRVYVAFASDF